MVTELSPAITKINAFMVYKVDKNPNEGFDRVKRLWHLNTQAGAKPNMAQYVKLEYKSKQNEKKNYVHKHLQANADGSPWPLSIMYHDSLLTPVCPRLYTGEAFRTTFIGNPYRLLWIRYQKCNVKWLRQHPGGTFKIWKKAKKKKKSQNHRKKGRLS